MIQDNLTGLFPEKENDKLKTLWKEHLDQTVCDAKSVDRGFEEIDCKNLNITFPYPQGTLLYLTLNRSSQQKSSNYNDETLKAYIRDRKQQMRNQYFSMSSHPCTFRNGKKLKIEIGIDGHPEKMKIFPLCCNSWHCPACAPRKAIAVGKYLTEVAIANNLIYYLTLTLNPNALNPEDIFSSTHRIITKFFNYFLTFIKRGKFKYFNEKQQKWYSFQLKNSGNPLKYIWVIEYQKNGLAHMHILLNQFLPVQVLRKVWTHVGGGHQMNIQRAKNIEAVARYITKYIFKTLGENIKGQLNFFNFEKRYSMSINCIRPPERNIRMFEKGLSNDEICERLNEFGLGEVYNKIQESPSLDINSSDL